MASEVIIAIDDRKEIYWKTPAPGTSNLSR